MSLEERVYKTLIVSSSEKFNEALCPRLAQAKCDPITYADSISKAKRLCLDYQFDFVIINSPLPDEVGTKFAIDVSTGKNSVCLMFVRSELYPEIRSKVYPNGVFTLPKPTSSTAISTGLDFLTSARERLRNMEKVSKSLEDKMKDMRTINHAKWLLMDFLKMSEPDAHRYIEKQAMDTCDSKINIAKQIISTYS